MPHSRARRRRKERKRIAEIKARQDALGEDAGYYAGDDCSCGVRLFFWLVPRDGLTPFRLHWPFMMSKKMSQEKHAPVVAHSAKDALEALADRPTEHDAHIEGPGNEFDHRLAHTS